MADGKEFLLSEDKARGIRIIGWWEPGDPRLHFRVEQEIPQSFLDANAAEAAETGRSAYGRSRIRVARVPHLLKQQWLKEIGADPGTPLSDDNPEVEKLFKRKLNDIDYRKLRTGGGRI